MIYLFFFNVKQLLGNSIVGRFSENFLNRSSPKHAIIITASYMSVLCSRETRGHASMARLLEILITFSTFETRREG